MAGNFYSGQFFGGGFFGDVTTTATPDGRGNIDWLKRKKKQKKMRYSDLEEREKAAIVIPESIPIVQEDDEDEVLIALLAKVLH